MSAEKDYIDRIIEMFCDSYFSAKKEPYIIGLGKKHYYNSADRQYVSNLISVYKQSKPDADTDTALNDFKKLFDTILNYSYESSFLASVTLYKVCHKLNDYKNYITNNKKAGNKEFNTANNAWINNPGTGTALVTVDEKKVSEVTKLPEIDRKYYTPEESKVIKQELLRLALARDENYSIDLVEEWLRSFSELNYTASKIVKCIRLVKLQPKYKTKEFAMFMQVDLNDYYKYYSSKK